MAKKGVRNLYASGDTDVYRWEADPTQDYGGQPGWTPHFNQQTGELEWFETGPNQFRMVNPDGSLGEAGTVEDLGNTMSPKGLKYIKPAVIGLIGSVLAGAGMTAAGIGPWAGGAGAAAGEGVAGGAGLSPFGSGAGSVGTSTSLSPFGAAAPAAGGGGLASAGVGAGGAAGVSGAAGGQALINAFGGLGAVGAGGALGVEGLSGMNPFAGGIGGAGSGSGLDGRGVTGGGGGSNLPGAGSGASLAKTIGDALGLSPNAVTALGGLLGGAAGYLDAEKQGDKKLNENPYWSAQQRANVNLGGAPGARPDMSQLRGLIGQRPTMDMTNLNQSRQAMSGLLGNVPRSSMQRQENERLRQVFGLLGL
jgi:hypothetical protein